MDFCTVFTDCQEGDTLHSCIVAGLLTSSPFLEQAHIKPADMSHPPNTLPSLTSIPPELQILIFTHLKDDKAASTCLGLTCKFFYNFHFAKHGKVSLLAPVTRSSRSHYVVNGPSGKYWINPYCLGMLLQNWIGPNWKFDGYRAKFVSVKDGHRDQ